MALFWKAAAGLLVAGVLVVLLGRQEKDIALLLAMGACTMAVTVGLSFLEPLMAFLRQMEDLGGLGSGVLNTLLKITGIGLVSEIGAMILSDSGNAALAKGLQVVASSVILYLSVPVFETLMELVQRILGEL